MNRTIIFAFVLAAFMPAALSAAVSPSALSAPGAAEALGLSDEQAAQIRDLDRDLTRQMVRLEADERLARLDLDEALEQPDAVEEARIEEIAKEIARVAAERVRMECLSQWKAARILSPQQRGKIKPWLEQQETRELATALRERMERARSGPQPEARREPEGRLGPSAPLGRQSNQPGPQGAGGGRFGQGPLIGFSRDEAAEALSVRLREAEQRLQRATEDLERERRAFEAEMKRQAKKSPAEPEQKEEGKEQPPLQHLP